MAMRFYDKRYGFEVTVGRDEVRQWKTRWPASGLGAGPYFFEFDEGGDIVDVQGPGVDSWADGPALGALMDDAKAYGECRQMRKTSGECLDAFFAEGRSTERKARL